MPKGESTQALTIVLYDVPPAEIRGNSRAHFRTERSINRQRREIAKLLTLDRMQETGIKSLKPTV